jgi:hypothetical protein
MSALDKAQVPQFDSIICEMFHAQVKATFEQYGPETPIYIYNDVQALLAEMYEMHMVDYFSVDYNAEHLIVKAKITSVGGSAFTVIAKLPAIDQQHSEMPNALALTLGY